MKVHLQENEPGYRLFLYIFYACAVIMASATVFGIIATLQEWSEKGNYAGAIGELETYMELVPGAKDEEPLRTTLAKLQELNGTAGAKRE